MRIDVDFIEAHDHGCGGVLGIVNHRIAGRRAKQAAQRRGHKNARRFYKMITLGSSGKYRPGNLYEVI